MWAGEHTFCKAFGEWIEVSGNINNIYPKQLKVLLLYWHAVTLADIKSSSFSGGLKEG